MSEIFAKRDALLIHRNEYPKSLPSLLSVISRLLFREDIVEREPSLSDKLELGGEGVWLVKKKMPVIGALSFSFPERRDLDFRFEFSQEGLKVLASEGHVLGSISSTWHGFFDFFSNERATDGLFMDGDWWVINKKANMFDTSDIGHFISALESLIPIYHSAPKNLRSDIGLSSVKYRKMECIDHRDEYNNEEFQSRYLSEGRPVLYTNSTRYWGLKNISIERLFDIYRDKYQHVNISGMSLAFPLSDYFDRLLNQVPVPFKAKLPLIKEIHSDFVFPPCFPEASYFKKSQGIIIGSKNSEDGAGYNKATSWHRDFSYNMFMHLAGRKRVCLAPPCEVEKFYVSESDACHHNVEFDCSPVNPKSPDLNKYPLFEGVKIFECIMEAGDTLFIPTGWFHNVDNLSDISVSINNWAFL